MPSRFVRRVIGHAEQFASLLERNMDMAATQDAQWALWRSEREFQQQRAVAAEQQQFALERMEKGVELEAPIREREFALKERELATRERGATVDEDIARARQQLAEKALAFQKTEWATRLTEREEGRKRYAAIAERLGLGVPIESAQEANFALDVEEKIREKDVEGLKQSIAQVDPAFPTEVIQTQEQATRILISAWSKKKETEEAQAKAIFDLQKEAGKQQATMISKIVDIAGDAWNKLSTDDQEDYAGGFMGFLADNYLPELRGEGEAPPPEDEAEAVTSFMRRRIQ